MQSVQTTNQPKDFLIGFDIKVKHGHLLEWLRQNDHTQAELGQLVGLNAGQIGRILNMQWIPPDRIQIKLAEVTKLEIETLFPLDYQLEVQSRKMKKALRLRLTKNIGLATLQGMQAMASLEPHPMPGATALTDGREILSHIKEGFANIKPREEEVLRLRFGVDKEGPLELKEIGKRFNLSIERIRQIEKGALDKMERVLHKYSDI